MEITFVGSFQTMKFVKFSPLKVLCYMYLMATIICRFFLKYNFVTCMRNGTARLNKISDAL